VTSYGKTTATGTLRAHLYKTHLKDWVDGCKELGISIKAKDAVEAIAASQGVRPNSEAPPRPKFTQSNFLDALAEFIVSTDQVCLDYLFLFLFTNIFLAYQYHRIY
jgi:hypothetical protein